MRISTAAAPATMLLSPHSSLLLYTMLNFGVAYRDTGYPHSELEYLQLPILRYVCLQG